MKRSVLIFNPKAGSWHTAGRIEALQRALRHAGYEATPRPTSAPGDATELARAAAQESASAVFVHGGDGTLREAAAGLLGSETALAPIPGGTVNVVALALGIPLDPLQAARSLAEPEAIDMDVGRCGDEIFLMQTSAGLDAHVMGRLHPGLKRRFGKAAVALSGLVHFPSYGYPEIDLIADGRRLAASMVAICNLPLYAGSWEMAPGASSTDGELDLVAFKGTGRLATLAFARDLVSGRHLDRADVEHFRVRGAELRGPTDLAVQLDGDALPIRLPVTVGLHPDRIRLLRPRHA